MTTEEMQQLESVLDDGNNGTLYYFGNRSRLLPKDRITSPAVGRSKNGDAPVFASPFARNTYIHRALDDTGSK